MALTSYYGHIVDANMLFSDGQTIPTSTNADSTNTLYIGGIGNGRYAVKVYVNTTLSSSAVLTIKALWGTTSSPTTDLGTTFCVKTLANDTAGTLLAEFVLPPELAKGKTYIKLNYTTGAAATGKLDAFLVPLG